jgi:Methyltransferase domain
VQAEATVTQRIDALDVTLFDAIEAQMNDSDKRSLLAIQSGFRQAYGTYTYLEIGSHLGGSLQSVVRDPACTRIVSIDPRPEIQPDARKGASRYPGNSTARMLELLGAIPGADLEKLETIEATTAELDPSAFRGAPTFCFVDGEHTDEAALRDARFCRRLLGSAGVIAFHDTSTVYRGLHAFLSELEDDRTEVTAYLLPHSVLAVELGPPRALDASQVHEVLRRSGRRVLSALMDNDFYRSAWERWPFRVLRPRVDRSRRERLVRRKRARGPGA